MAKSNKVIPKKKRGRPATGKDPITALRLPPTLLAAVEAWAKKQVDDPNRSEAIRRLVEIGLGSAKIARGQKRSDSPTARDLAAAQIDRLTDPAAPADEQAHRKRRLLKGPEEFREVRVDRTKKK
jgi:hypothetical protein